VTSLLTLMKGLPSGYNRDQQHDRRAILGVVPRVCGDTNVLRQALPHVHFVPERCAAGLADGSTQATDLAEALVRAGVPFREAYKAVGALAALDPIRAVAAKESAGGTGPRAVAAQLASARARATELHARASAVPTLRTLARAIATEPLTP